MAEADKQSGPAKPVDGELAKHFFDYVGRHLVCLAVQLVDFDKHGQPSAEERFVACSGFIMSFGEMWFFVTAGHVLKNLDDGIKKKQIAITSCCFADYFGLGAQFPIPTPFDYQNATKAYIDDDAIGLDVGIIYLSSLYREGFKKNAIIPISEVNWIYQHKVEFKKHFLLGFPKALVDEKTPRAPRGQIITADVRPMLIPVRQIINHTEIPAKVHIRKSALDLFVGRIESSKIPSIEGMSGGPIIGLRPEPDGGTRYWFVALQSAWFPSEQIILACPLPIFAEIIFRLLKENGVTERNIK